MLTKEGTEVKAAPTPPENLIEEAVMKTVMFKTYNIKNL